MMTVPLVDLQALYASQQAELDEALRRVMASGRYVLGGEEAAFEREFAAWCGVEHCVGVASGTDAVELALRGAGVQPGDAVATVSHTAVATVAAVERLGAVPVLVDVDPARCTMDPVSLQAALEEANQSGHPVKAVLPVHLYGQCADMDAIMPLARAHGCLVIEDCAQAHGAALHGQKAGSFGHAAAFSFYPTKNLGAFGDGGAVLTPDGAVAERVRLARQYGWKERYISAEPGFNSRLDELQAALLRVRLTALEAENAHRAQCAAHYAGRLKNAGIGLPLPGPGCGHVYHVFVVRLQDEGVPCGPAARDDCAAFLAARGIGSGVHYPVPVHLQPAYAGRLRTAPGGLPHTEALAGSILSLPMHPHLTCEAVDYVCDALIAWRATFRSQRI